MGNSSAVAAALMKRNQAVQARLNAQGFDLTTDGVVGPKTQAALRAFQAKAGLPVTGQISPATLVALTQAPAGRVPTPNLRPAPDALTGGRPSPAPGIPPAPQMRPLIRPEALASPGDTLPAPGQPVPLPNLRPPMPQPQQVAPQPLFANQLGNGGGAPQPPVPTAPQPTGPIAAVPPGGRFAQPTFDAMQRMDFTNGTRGDEARAMAIAAQGPVPTMNIGGSGRPNVVPLSGQAGPRGPSGTAMPAMPPPQAIAAAKAVLTAALQAQQAAAAASAPRTVAPASATGYGLPGMQPNSSFLGAMGDVGNTVGGFVGNAANQLGGIYGAQ